MPTIKELFPEMPDKTRQRLGKKIKENKIEAVRKVPVTHYENDYSDEDVTAITHLAAILVREL